MAASGRHPQQPTAVLVLLMLATATARNWVDINVGGRTSMSSLMGRMASPLSKSKAGSYAKLFNSTGSVGDLCQDGHLYCDADAYNSYYEGLQRQLLDEKVEEKGIPVFFRESELVVGRKVTIVDPGLQSAAMERNARELSSVNVRQLFLLLFKGINDAERPFLPVELAQTLPFTSTSASLVFKVDPSSTLARESSKTVQICREAGSTTEAAACATSLEGLESLLSSPMMLGPGSMDALTTDAQRSNFTGKVVQLRLEAGEGKRHAVCHNLMYPSAVYLCHYGTHTRVYSVTLQQADSQLLLRTVAVCHMDNAGWNPRHLAFQNLLTLPGQAEACHWVLPGSLTFVTSI